MGFESLSQNHLLLFVHISAFVTDMTDVSAERRNEKKQ